MNRSKFEKIIIDNYNCTYDYPWAQYPTFRVFRHSNNKKWFAVIMDIPKNKLGLKSNEIISVVNLKCDSLLIGSLLLEDGFYPSYHMNKNNWISVALDSTADDEKLKMLLDMSFDATSSRTKQH